MGDMPFVAEKAAVDTRLRGDGRQERQMVCDTGKSIEQAGNAARGRRLTPPIARVAAGLVQPMRRGLPAPGPPPPVSIHRPAHCRWRKHDEEDTGL
jgi:hypothetical protein